MTLSKKSYTERVERTVVLLVALSFPALMAGAGELELSGSVALEARMFLSAPLSGPSYVGQSNDPELSLILSPELHYESQSGTHQFALLPFLRLDDLDDERTHVDLREATWRLIGNGDAPWELLVGVNRVFWGVTESRHLVDIVNQDDAVEDIDGEDKLGQPMVELTLLRDWGTLSVYVLPFFRERTFPGRKGRLRTPLVVDTDQPLFESSAEEWHTDIALRYSHYIGDWDIGLSYFEGTSREPRLVPSEEGDRHEPVYDQIRQLGVDVQHTRGAWLWKLESLVREGQGSTFGAAVAGFEYTLYQLGGGAADLGLLAEVLYDDRDPLAAPPTLFDDDVFVGARLAWNDTQDTALLVGGVVDREDGSTAWLVEGERRLGSRFKVEVESRLFTSVSSQNLLASVESDDVVTLRLSRFF